MKKILLCSWVLAAIGVSAQSYNYVGVDANYNINQNVNQRVSGYIYENKTITTIDYGALALANAQMQAQQLEAMKYQDAQEQRKALEMANNPLKAYDYGNPNIVSKSGKEIKDTGFKKYTVMWIKPHNSVFYWAGVGRMENKSPNGITTELIVYAPLYNWHDRPAPDLAKMARMENVVEGSVTTGKEPIYVVKKSASRANVFGVKGYKTTLMWEDDFQICITDNFFSWDESVGNGVQYMVKVRTYGNKDEVTMEALEGRRYYLRPLVEKVVATAKMYNVKCAKTLEEEEE